MIHALPGLGANNRMFPSHWDTLSGFVAHDWPPYQGEKSLKDLAASVVKSFQISDGDAVVGASLGGMVACEIGKIRNIKRLYLVGSATSKSEISKLLEKFHPLANYLPAKLLQLSAGIIPTELTQMYSRADPAFMSAMSAAIFEWEGQGITRIPVYRIHGKRDVIIPPPKESDLLLGGGHFISMTHARECVEFIKASEQNPIPKGFQK